MSGELKDDGTMSYVTSGYAVQCPYCHRPMKLTSAGSSPGVWADDRLACEDHVSSARVIIYDEPALNRDIKE